MKKIILSLLTLSGLSYGGGCLLVQSGDINVTWQGYKQLSKKGVDGAFTSVKYSPHAKEGANFAELLVGSTLTIDTTQIETGNPARDETLVKMFFGQLSTREIEGKIIAMRADKHERGSPYTGVLDLELKLNAKQMTIPMSYHYSKERFVAEGVIDLFDFSANEALRSLNSSCGKYHQGKTWSDVRIGFATNIRATLCRVKTEK